MADREYSNKKQQILPQHALRLTATVMSKPKVLMSERGMRRSASPFLTIPKSMQWSRCMYTPGTEGGTGVTAEGGAVGGGGGRKRGAP